MDTKNWIAVGAAGALSLGVAAGGAASIANAMPLIENVSGLSVPGLTTVTDDNGGSADLDFTVESDSIVSPTSSPSPATPSPVSAQTPASPLSPASPISPASPASPLSPASVDTPPTPATPASIPSPASPASIDD
jgi:hypothetical protein